MESALAFERRTMFSPAPWRSALPPRHREVTPARAELTVGRRAMACEFSVTFPGTVRDGVGAGCAALDQVERLEAVLSAYREESDIARLNRSTPGEWTGVAPETCRLLDWALRLSEATGGAFDPASGALVKAWGFFRGPRRVPPDDERRAALAASGGRRHVQIRDGAARILQAGVELNLGAIGKGYAIDLALAMLQTRFGVRSALMQGGQSSLKAIGSWTVAIGDPVRPGRTLAHVRLRNRALGTSAASNQFFVHAGRRYGHILDPRTGWPANRLLGASALAGSATEADALSTAFFVMGLEATRQFCTAHPEYGAVLVCRGEKQGAAQVVILGAADAEVMR